MGNTTILNSRVAENVAAGGGGIHIGGTTFQADGVSIEGNRSGSSGGGGLFQVGGHSDLKNVTAEGNVTASNGGGLYIQSGTGANWENVTASGNRAGQYGGGLAFASNQVMTLTHATVADNTAVFGGGGIFVSPSAPNLTISYTIVANNLLTDGTISDVDGTPISGGYNLIESTAGSSGWVGSDVVGVDPNLLAIDDYGGPVRTYGLESFSLAIDGAIGSGVSTDARGATRIDADIGAFEYNADPSFDSNYLLRLTWISSGATNPPGNTISEIIGSWPIFDTPGSLQGVAIVDTESPGGNWEYSTNGGTTWTDFGAVSSASALLLRSTDRVRFVPSGVINGPARVRFLGWDQFQGTAGTKVDTNSKQLSGFSSHTASFFQNFFDINNAPVVYGLEGSSVNYQAGLAPVVLDSSVSVFDTSLNAANGGLGDYSGATFRLVRSTGPDITDVFGFEPANGLSKSGNTIVKNGSVVATFDTTTTPGELFITFTSANGETATTAVANDVLRLLTYRNSDPKIEETIELNWIFNEGSENGSNLAASTQTSKVHLKPWTIIVNTFDDELDGNTSSVSALNFSGGGGTGISLREAIIAANNTIGSVTILLNAGIYELSIAGRTENLSATGDLDIDSDITIIGAGLEQTTIDGGFIDRLFDIRSGSSSISSLTITGGENDDHGGAITVDAAANLELNQVKLLSNKTTLYTNGGAIYSTGTLTVTNSTFESNKAIHSGGALAVVGGSATISDTTFTGNFAGNYGGAIYHRAAALNLDRVSIYGNVSKTHGGGIRTGVSASGSWNNLTVSGNEAGTIGGGISIGADSGNIDLTHSTVAFNVAGNAGGGIHLNGESGVFSIQYSIVSNNVLDDGSASDVYGDFQSDGYNLIQDSTGSTGWDPSDQLGVDPLLGALADNGGTVKTHAVSDGSGAIDQAVTSTENIDGRGYHRVGNADIGAFESNHSPVLADTGDLSLTSIRFNEIDSDGNTVAEILASGGSDVLTDVDSGAVEGIAIESVTGNGTWQFSLDSGITWQDIGIVSSNSALLLAATDRVRFVPAQPPTESAMISFRGWDQRQGVRGEKKSTTTAGGTTAFSSLQRNAVIELVAPNYFPVISNLENVSATYVTGHDGISIGSGVTINDIELDRLNKGLGDYDGSRLTISRTPGFDSEDVFGFQDNNGITLVGGNLIKDGQTIATFDTTTTVGILEVQFTSASGVIPTSEDVNNIVGGITYLNSNGSPPVSVDLQWTFNDGDSTFPGIITREATVTIQSNSAPTASNFTASLDEDQKYVFTVDDFQFVDSDGDPLDHVTIATLEATGRLTLSGVDVTANQQIIRTDIEAGNLVFTPLFGESGSGYDSFTFSVSDQTATSASTYTMTMDVEAVNDEPTFYESPIGTVLSDFGSGQDNAYDIATLDDGRFYIPVTNSNGEFVLARYNEDGSLDQTFGSGTGYVTTVVGPGGSAQSITIQADGKVIVAGLSNNGDFVVVRYLDDGTLDSSFGGSGIVEVDFVGFTDQAYSVNVDSSGRIVIAGSVDATDSRFGVARLLSNGSMDSSFGVGGITTIIVPADASPSYVTDATILSSGKIAITGFISGTNAYAVVILNDNGNLDSSFNGDGIKIHSLASFGTPQKIMQQSDGKILVAGNITNTTYDDVAVVRFNLNGSVDTSYGVAGLATYGLASSVESISHAAIQDDDKVVLFPSLSPDNNHFTGSVTRLNTDGSIDTSFGNGGTVSPDFSPNSSVAQSGAVASDGKIIVVSRRDEGPDGDIAIGRFNADGSIDQSFGGESSLEDSVNWKKGTPAVVLDSTITVQDIELDNLNGGAGNYSGAIVSLQRITGADTEDVFSFQDGNGFVLSGGNITSSGVVVATFETASPAGQLTIQFSDASGTIPTTADVRSILQQITYQNTNNSPPSSVQISWLLQDGNFGTQGTGGTGVVLGSTTVSITAFNEAPSFGTPNYTKHTISSSADGARSVVTADIDGDGDLDVLSASSLDDKIVWYENDGQESFTAHVITTGADSAFSVAAADVDGDGDLDVLSASAVDDTIAWYENDGNQNFIAHVITNSADAARSVTTADIDGDGDLDVLSASQNDDTIAWYENDGNQNFIAHNISTTANSARRVSTADVDGDGDLDVLSASFGDNTIAWYENDGGGNFTAHIITSTALGTRDVGTADIDGDGDLDVFSASQTNNTVAWYENDGSENFTAHVVTTTAMGIKSVSAGDLDGDGDMDLLSASSDDDTIAWYQNDGSGNFQSLTITVTADGAFDVWTADVDGDGDLDVFSTSRDDDSISWYESTTTLNGSSTFTENGAAVVLDADVDISDSELDALNGGSGNYSGASVRLVRSGGPNIEDVFSFEDGNGITRSGSILVKNGQTIATFDITTVPGELLIVWTDANGEIPTSTDVDNILRQIKYANSSDAPPSSIRIDWTFDDGNTGNQGPGGSRTVAGSTIVTITETNDAPSFDVGTGIALADIAGGYDYGHSVATQPDGKILMAGYSDVGGGHDFSLIRRNADGTIDTSFGGGDGIVTQAIGTGADRAFSVTIQLDGKILVAGYSDVVGGRDIALVRFNADGSLDTTFSGDGMVTTSLGGGTSSSVAVVKQQSDGKILVAGHSDSSGTNDFAVVRYNLDGTLDTGFGGGGIVLTDFGGTDDQLKDLAIQSDGKIVVAGKAGNQHGLVRYHSDGTLDTSFDGDGKIVTAAGSSSSEGSSVSIQSDGKIIVGGFVRNGSDYDFSAIRYNTDGSLDTSYGGGDGIATADIGGEFDLGLGAALQADGKFVVVGEVYVNGFYEYGVARWNTDGTLDTTFGGGDGVVTTNILAGNDIAESVLIQPDGKILLAGISYGGPSDFSMVRYNSDGSLDLEFSSIFGSSLDGNPDYTEGDSAVILDSDVRVSDSELDALNNGDGNYNGASVTLVRDTGANNEDIFSFVDGNGITLSGTNLVKNGQSIASFDIATTSGELVITWTDANGEIPTSADVDSILRQIAYSNSSNIPPASVQIDWTFDDGNSGVQGSGGSQSVVDSTIVNITAINDSPTFLSSDVPPEFTEKFAANAPNDPYSLAAGDVDGDGDLDFVAASYSTDEITWYENDGAENFTMHTITSNADGARWVVLEDLDGDGDLDAISASVLDDKIAWYENDGAGNFTDHVIATDADGVRGVFVSDVDGDGDLDVLSASGTDDKIAWYENDGAENFTAHVVTTDIDAYSVTAADVDGDGDLDLISASYNDDKVTWFENDGAENFTAHTISSSARGARYAIATDVDGDGDLDVISISGIDDKIAWYENDGAQNFTERIITTDADGGHSIAIADVDSDGDLDVFSASFYDNKIAWYENDGSENFTTHILSSDAINATFVTTADVDGDGDLDVVSSSAGDNKIRWYENSPVNTLNDSVSYTEGDPAVVLDPDVDVRDSELDALNSGDGNYNGASVRLSRSGGPNGDDSFSFLDASGISLAGSNLVKNSQIIATFDTTSTPGELVIQFTDANSEIPTSADVDNILRQIKYQNTSDLPPASVQIDWTFEDGNSGSQGSGGNQSVVGHTTVQITEVNDTPTDIQIIATSDGGLEINKDGGNNSYLLAENGSDLLGGLSQFTFESQFSTTSTVPNLILISYAIPGADNELVVHIENGVFKTQIGSTLLQSSAVDYRNFADGQQHTFSFTWENGSGNWNIYVDGIQIDSGSGIRIGYTLGTGGTALFGQEQDSLEGTFDPDQIFEGSFYDIRIFDHVRSEEEIKANYRSQILPDEDGLIANWRFDKLQSNGIISDTVSGNDLSLKNFQGAGFSANDPTLSLSVNESEINGTAIGNVSGVDPERQTRIQQLLDADPNLHYNEQTGKFYQTVSTPSDFSTARSDAESAVLNGVNGQLLTIDSAIENQFVFQFVNTFGQSIWLGGTDQTTQGQWRWIKGGSESDIFWRGDVDGATDPGSYSNWSSNEPDQSNERHLVMDHQDGGWLDVAGSSSRYSVIEWNADEVLDATSEITYSIHSQTVAGAFEIDADGGDIRLVDSSLLDYSTNSSHTITVRATDDDGDYFEKAVSIQIVESLSATTPPTSLTSGIDLNLGQGNDAYLVTSDGGNILGGLGELTIEATISSKEDLTNATIFSYASSDGSTNELLLRFDSDGELVVHVSNLGISFETGIYANEFPSGEARTISISRNDGEGLMKSYLDGELVSEAIGSYGSATIRGNGTITIGQDQDTVGGGFQSGNHFSGTVYDLRIWNDTRTVQEIALNYNRKFDSSDIPSGLLANWQMDGFDGSGNVVDIVSGNDLSVGHASGTGYVAGTAVAGLFVDEKVFDGTVIGTLRPTDQHIGTDVVKDGLFQEASNPGIFTVYTIGTSFGSWTVSQGSIDLIGTDFEKSPLGGRSIDLDGFNTGAIQQTISTEAGKSYQVIFALSGNWSSGESKPKSLQVSADGVAEVMTIARPDGWSESDMKWDHRTFNFTASSSSSLLEFLSVEIDGAPHKGAVIADVQVIEIPEAVSSILNSDPSLQYNAATGKFYRYVTTAETWTDAKANAEGLSVNGVAGSLVRIESVGENNYLQNLLDTTTNVWIGGSDQDVEGEWRWHDDGQASDQFWSGDDTGSAVGGNFTNWRLMEPNAISADEDYALFRGSDGKWVDASAATNAGYFVQWDAVEVLSNYNFSLLDDAGGRFQIDASTGDASVADSSLLDFETDTSHDIQVRVIDALGASYDQTVTIQVNNQGGEPSQAVPATQNGTEDNPITFSSSNGNEITVNETSAVDGFLQVELSIPSGTLTLAQTTGIIIVHGENGTNQIVLNGKESDLNAALDGLVYQPAENFNGSIDLTVTTSASADLVGHYMFENGNADDASFGDLQDGALQGDASVIADPDRGQVLNLDGTGDSVQISGRYGEPSSVTLAAWVNLTDPGPAGAEVITLGTDVGIRLDSATGIHFFGLTSGGYQGVNHSISLNGSGWHHVAATVDDATKERILYLDGLEVARLTASGSLVYGTTHTNSYIGKHGDPSNSAVDFGGQIDDVRVYGRALSADEIAVIVHGSTSTTDTIELAFSAVNDIPTFVTEGGFVKTDFENADDKFPFLLVQPDGKYIQTGMVEQGTNEQFGLVRFLADGQLDLSFGVDGKVITDLGFDDVPHVSKLQPDGKILVGGYSKNGSEFDFAVVRYHSDGTIDTSFGTGGQVIVTGFSTNDYVYSIELQDDGKILLGGSMGIQMGMVRLHEDGSLDTSFGGGDGVEFLQLGGGTTYGRSLVIQDDGKILFGGTSHLSGSFRYTLARFHSDGSLDTSYGGGAGYISHQFGSSDFLHKILPQNDGSIILVGNSDQGGTSTDIALTRYDSDGNLDTGFGNAGSAILDIGGNSNEVYSATLQTDGKIIVGAVARISGSEDYAVVCFNVDGSLDTTFGEGNGYVVHSFDSGNERPTAIEYLQDGKILVSGYSNFGDDDFYLYRLNSDGSLDNTFGSYHSVNQTRSFIENGTFFPLDSYIVIADPELDALNSGNGDYSGAVVRIGRQSGLSSEDQFSFLDGNGIVRVGNTISVSGSVIATFDTSVSGELTVTFTNANGQIPTTEMTKSVFQQIQYLNTSDNPPASVDLTWTLYDGNTGSQGSGGQLFTTGTTTVEITAINDDPYFSGSIPTDLAAVEDISAVVQFSLLSIVDIDDNQLPITVTLQTSADSSLVGVSDGYVTISGSGTSTLSITGRIDHVNSFLNSPNWIRYLHNEEHYNGDGVDSITVSVTDNGNTGLGGGSLIGLGILNIDIQAVNDAPESMDDSFEMDQADTLVISGLDILSNDYDVEQDPLSFVIVNPPSHGTVTINPNGEIVYIPEQTYFGEDYFHYISLDGDKFSAPTKVLIQVNAIGTGNSSDNNENTEETETETEKEDDSSMDKELPAGEGAINQNEDSNSSDQEQESMDEEEEESGKDSSSAKSAGNGGKGTGKSGNKNSLGSRNGIGDLSLQEIGLPTTDMARGVFSLLTSSELSADSLESSSLDRLGLGDISISAFFNAKKFEKEFESQISEAENEMKVKERLIEGSLLTGTYVATIGYILWTLRGGVLMASLFSSLPNWKFIDPLPVLDKFSTGDMGDGGESLEKMLDNQILEDE